MFKVLLNKSKSSEEIFLKELLNEKINTKKLDKLYKELNISVAKRKLSNFRSNLKSAVQEGGNSINGERARLMRQYEAIKQEVQTYENNLGFLNSSSKKGNSLIDEMNRKVQKLKDDMELVKQKIKAIDEEYKQA